MKNLVKNDEISTVKNTDIYDILGCTFNKIQSAAHPCKNFTCSLESCARLTRSIVLLKRSWFISLVPSKFENKMLVTVAKKVTNGNNKRRMRS
jgi:hypothetical protein